MMSMNVLVVEDEVRLADAIGELKKGKIPRRRGK